MTQVYYTGKLWVNWLGRHSHKVLHVKHHWKKAMRNLANQEVKQSKKFRNQEAVVNEWSWEVKLTDLELTLEIERAVVANRMFAKWKQCEHT